MLIQVLSCVYDQCVRFEEVVALFCPLFQFLLEWIWNRSQTCAVKYLNKILKDGINSSCICVCAYCMSLCISKFVCLLCVCVFCLSRYGHFSGINRKVQLTYLRNGQPKASSEEEGTNTHKHTDNWCLYLL